MQSLDPSLFSLHFEFWVNAFFRVKLSSWGAFTYDVRCFLGIFDLPTYPNQILYYISLFSKIR